MKAADGMGSPSEALLVPTQRAAKSGHPVGTIGYHSLHAGSALLMGDPASLTELIHRAQDGDAGAADALFAATYDDLRRIARARLHATGRTGTLDTSALVHESYLRFAAAGRLQIQDRLHFMRWAGRVMRSVIVDFARRRKADRRGGDAARVTLTDRLVPGRMPPEDEILRVHEALDQIAGLDQRLAKVVELRYFAGMNDAEIAEALGVTDRTVRRDWEKARLLLQDALR
jgi:RNA polymerase sigma factor (TIGR02999 family)